MSHELPNTSDDELQYRMTPTVPFDALELNAKSNSVQWGPSPLNAFYSTEISDDQENVRHTLEIRARSVPPELGPISEEIQSFVSHSFIARFTDRVMANYDNFGKRLKRTMTDITLEEMHLVERSLAGDASPAELMYVRQLLGIGSIELGCLTHPYGNNIDKLDTMRGAVVDAVGIFGGTLLDEKPYYAVKQADNLYMKYMTRGMHDAFLMTRKRDLAVLPDRSLIRERSSFIVRIDEASGFDQQIAKNIRKVPVHNNPNWTQHIAIAGRLNEVVPPLLENNEFSKAIPSATTIYNFDRETIARIKMRDRTEHLLGNTGIAFMRKPEDA